MSAASRPASVIPAIAGVWRQVHASPATANYQVYPGDGPPTLSDTLGQPQTGASFTDGKIVVTGRAELRAFF